ncbi:MAG: cryptochrome/photolyase family protein [Chlamydiae bacterium]|nr:cryptochrome/photolyase family protein [Chlamydiota bacterium]
MKDITLIFPHHLFKDHPGLSNSQHIWFLEDPLFFSDPIYPALFHKQKIMFHRASMKQWQEILHEKGFKTKYWERHQLDPKYHKLAPLIKGCRIHVAELDDEVLSKRISSLISKAGAQLIIHSSPGFITPLPTFEDIFRGKSHYFFHSFYIEQRKMHHVLVDDKLKPVGGKWSFDTENRKKTPKNLHVPPIPSIPLSEPILEAKKYTQTHFAHHVGNTDSFIYPTTHELAKKWLDDFLRHKLHLFGDYEDAIQTSEPFLFHSVLSPLLNAGLLTPVDVVNKTLEYASKHDISLNSLEGFLRQVIGWREFVRGVYLTAGTKQRKSNLFKHQRKMPACFYDGSSGIDPVDISIQKAKDFAYCHHIERLMVLGNFFLLCEIHPDEIYRWFMEMFIDAYDWVMVPNVYGMSQYADGGLMTTKPYLSGSSYLRKMSNFKKGPWMDIWDALFWRFFIKHLPFFEAQPRLQMLCSMAKKKKNDTDLLRTAETFLKDLL